VTVRHRGGHPAQVIGHLGPAFESGGSSNLPDYRPDPWGEYDEELGGYVNAETHEFSPGPDRPAPKLPPRDRTGRFTS